MDMIQTVQGFVQTQMDGTSQDEENCETGKETEFCVGLFLG